MGSSINQDYLSGNYYDSFHFLVESNCSHRHAADLLHLQHPNSRSLCAMAKRTATELGSEICAMAMQIMGEEGLLAVSKLSLVVFSNSLLSFYLRLIILKGIFEIFVFIRS